MQNSYFQDLIKYYNKSNAIEKFIFTLINQQNAGVVHLQENAAVGTSYQISSFAFTLLCLVIREKNQTGCCFSSTTWLSGKLILKTAAPEDLELLHHFVTLMKSYCNACYVQNSSLTKY